jgi:hypothetical protein
MRLLFERECCIPRDEVLKGELKEDLFAARLQAVMEGKAEEVYQNPAIFFANTYPTEGLKVLLTEALGRLSGQKTASSPIIRLETSFGGGKTHNLIALKHLADGFRGPGIEALVDSALLPEEAVAVAGIVGSELDPENGLEHNGLRTFTPWGEIAYQLGGPVGYQRIAHSDQQGIAPGAATLEELVGNRPALIMLDELAHFLRVAKAKKIGDTNLADMTIAFLMSLFQLAASKARVVVVLTLAETFDAYGKETEELRQRLAEAKSLAARQERVITPTAETEIAAIVTHRLFKYINRDAAQETAAAYYNFYQQLQNQNANIPGLATRSEYSQQIIDEYPFHPTFLKTLNTKTATIPNFQRTRGALRLLAMTIRRLWENQPADTYLIHPHHLDLGVGEIVAELTSRLDRPQFRSIVEADIISSQMGTLAKAQDLDRHWVEAGKPPYAQRLATTIFLHSLTQGVASGVDPAELFLSVLTPGDDPLLLQQALDHLEDSCWYLNYDGRRYRFGTEPAPAKLIADEMSLVGRVKAKDEVDRRIRQIWPKGIFTPVYFPSEAAEVDDDAKAPKLVILHYDAAKDQINYQGPPDLVAKIFNHAGTQEGYRKFKNNLLFLVADQGQVDPMVNAAQRYLAIQRLVSDPERLKDFPENTRSKLKKMSQETELEVRVAITKAYRYLYYPSADAPQKHHNLARETLPAQDQGEMEKDQSQVLLKILRDLNKAKTADDPPLAPQFLKAKAWPGSQESISTEDLRRAFAQRLGLPLLLDPNQLKRTIKEGIKHGVWVYYDPREEVGYGPDSPAPLVQLDEDTLLYLPEEARRLGIRFKGEKRPEPEPTTCPVCQQPVAACVCDQVCPICRQFPCVCQMPDRFRAEGPPARAFQNLSDQCADRRVETLKNLRLLLEGNGREGAQDLRSLGLAIPQLGKGSFSLKQDLTLEFGPQAHLKLHFEGPWERYKRLKQITEAFAQEADKLTVKTELKAEFPDGLSLAGDQFQTMRDVFTALGLGKLVLEAEPAEEGGRHE